MKIQRLFSILLFCSMLGSGSLMAQSISDSQVLEYVKDGIRQGKEQKQLASELARKGVTKEQAMRVKQLYEQQNNVNTSQSTGTDINESRLREETKENTSDMLEDHPTTEDLAREDQVFGRNIFNTRNLTFEPSVNLATPANYRLGPGDEVIIDIWGASQNTIHQQISPEGTINIQKIGPVNLSGMTVSAANEYLKGALNKIYNGLNNTTDPTSDIRLTLGNIRTIQINAVSYTHLAKRLRLNFPVTSYTLRHSWATTAKYRGVPIEMISESLGHKSIKTTQIYLKGFELKERTEVNRMNLSYVKRCGSGLYV